ncbi:DUF2252 domain-containing protein [Blastococcus litoris]|uniref:DUF2252 domain-containing protein n=1 Tax=Blastococcus litoris TaxID=2171622 RepID=UPI0019D065D0|nr:DUF2252 domain-containing protein [Blastococcus litoris]
MLTVERPAPGPDGAARRGGRPTPKERRASGKALRARAPLDGIGAFDPGRAGRDPVALLEEQSADRVPELVPIRYGRMLQSPFAFYRGAARVMAADLAGAPRSGLTVQMCGDAHVANFGLYGSPERRLVFDANDFDETLPGPFEHDVQRLVASLVVAARGQGVGRKQRRALALAAGRRYRTAMAEFAEARDIEVWYSRIDAEELQRDLSEQLESGPRKRLAKAIEKAHSRDTMQAFGKLTEVVDGRLRIRAEPPLLVPLRDLLPETEERDLESRFHALIRQYRGTLQSDRRTLLERYSFVDMARKVVGVGSVGTRCWVVLLTGRDSDDPLLLQVKEASRSVHEDVVGRSSYTNQGHRVVAGQRLMQQASDIFLGWQRTTGIDGIERDFYVRQLRDWKGSIEVGELRPEGLTTYGELCAWCLARAHARSGDRIAVAGYLGSSPAFENALADFAEAYADVTEVDHDRLAAAVAAGRLEARSDL